MGESEITIATPQFGAEGIVREWAVQTGVVEDGWFIPNGYPLHGHKVAWNDDVRKLWNGMSPNEFAKKCATDLNLRKQFESMPESGRFM